MLGVTECVLPRSTLLAPCLTADSIPEDDHAMDTTICLFNVCCCRSDDIWREEGWEKIEKKVGSLRATHETPWRVGDRNKPTKYVLL